MGQVTHLTYRPQLPSPPDPFANSKGMLCILSQFCAQFRYALAGAMLDQFLYRDAMHHRGKIVELAARAVGGGPTVFLDSFARESESFPLSCSQQ